MVPVTTSSDAFDDLLREAMQRGATDLHLRAGDVLRAHVNDELVGVGQRILSRDDLTAFAERLLHESPVPTPPIHELLDFQFPWGAPGIGRFRVSILRQRSTFMVVMRVIPYESPSVTELGLPAAAISMTDADSGLVLVTGPAKSGRSLTVSALVRQLNETSPWRRYISMLEQPIRVLQPDGKCSIVQREVGVDTKDFASGFASALEHDADVIVLACDLSDDPALLDMALHAAESGKLVIGKMSAPDVSSTFQALFARAQSGAQADMRVRVAGAVRGVLSQRLLRRADGAGRVAVVEAYLSSPELQRMLLDPGSFLDVREALAAARPLLGTQTFDQHLGDLVQDGVISIEVAMGLAVHPADLRQRLRPAKNA